MIESFLNEENKNKIKRVIHDTVWPIKIYSIILVFIMLLIAFYLYKIYTILHLHLKIK
jgi:hypothetical protein